MRDPLPDSGGLRRPFVGGVPVFIKIPPPPDHVPVTRRHGFFAAWHRMDFVLVGLLLAIDIGFVWLVVRLTFGWRPW